MHRILEPEVMDDPEQASAYAQADFERENQEFVERFLAAFPDLTEGHIVDLGCGPADIPIRLARALPRCRITGIDASLPMIRLGEQAIIDAGLVDRITLRCERIQSLVLPELVDAVVSNSLLHHIPNPLRFWLAVKQLVRPGSYALVMDLLRPASTDDAAALVDQYASNEPVILRRDFYNSLLAAFTEDEVAAQLAEMNLSRLLIDVPDDRHWLVSGLVY